MFISCEVFMQKRFKGKLPEVLIFLAGTHPLSITLSVRKYVRSSDVTPEALVGTCLQLLQFRNYEDIIET